MWAAPFGAVHSISNSALGSPSFNLSGCLKKWVAPVWLERAGKGYSICMNYVHPPNKQLYYEQVWALVRQIPSGRIATYGQITKMLPQPGDISAQDYQMSASRWVGLAMSACPDDVPWHRVINSQGKISHKSEAGEQKRLLEGEGVLFLKEKIDLGEFQWRGLGQCDEPMQGRLF